MVLCVAEKPSVAKTASQILSRGKSRAEQSCSKYNLNYKFQGKFQNQDVEYCFTSVAGHVYQSDFPPEYGNWARVEPADLFKAPILRLIPESNKDLVKNLETQSRKASFLFLWLDNDREGEGIAEEVEDICLKINRNLQVWRARFAALAPRDLWHALDNPVQINRADSAAVRFRSDIDFRSGAAFTRFQSLRYKGKLDSGKVISYGTCQFPTLGFIVDRYLKKEAFVAEAFWVIECQIKKR